MSNMHTILLVGGQSSRFNDYNRVANQKPKSLGLIDKETLIAHVIKNFSKYNYNNFILPLGYYNDEFIKYFNKLKKIGNKKCNIFLIKSKYLKLSILKNDEINIFLLNTGKLTNKAERICKVINLLKLDEFIVSYGDAVGNVNLKKVNRIHKNSKSFVTGVGMIMKSQYGHYSINKQNIATEIIEKPTINKLVNIGYFFFKKEAINYFIKYKNFDLEEGVIKKLVQKKKVIIYEHKKFWKSIDTLKDLNELKIHLNN